jgi:hypothetical protein
LTAAIALAGSISGCGGVGDPVVASVGGHAISARSLGHWMRIENARSQISVPDPPAYRRCSAAASVLQRRLGPRRRLDRDALRDRCAAVYRLLERKALGFLITADWLELEAAAQGISVSASEVQTSYRQLLSGPAGPAFAERLRRRGMSRLDESFQLRLEKLAEKLRAKIAVGSTGRPDQRARAFIAAYRRRWKQRTSCRAGYVVPECGNGPPLPRSAAE